MTPAPEWDGKERRNMGDFEREQISFMAEMREHMRHQAARCDSHAKDIHTLDTRTTSLEGSRDYATGAIKTIGVGAPAIGGLAWFVFKLGRILKDLP